jgi:hypothetical protein
MNIVSKMVADAWIKRYKKEMSKKEYTAWRKNFDQQTIVREVIDGVVFYDSRLCFSKRISTRVLILHTPRTLRVRGFLLSILGCDNLSNRQNFFSVIF